MFTEGEGIERGPLITTLQRAAYIVLLLFMFSSDCTFAAAGDKVFVVSSKAGVDGVEALGHTLVLPHKHPVLKVPQVHSLRKVLENSV